ncbi:extracellular solute-binding protein [Peptoniphilaceae bacterium SGI.131]
MKKFMAVLLAAMLILTACKGSSKETEKTDKGTTSEQAKTESDSTKDNNNTGEKKKLVISTWGSNEEVLRKDVIEPFEKEFNVEVVLDIGSTSERLTKLKEDPNYEADIIELSQSAALEAQELGLVDKIESSKVKDYENLIPVAKEFASRGYGIPYTINSIGIIYNPNGAKKEIKEWADLWDAALAGRIAVPDITSTFGPAIIAMAGDVAGTPIDKDNGQKAFEKLKELKPNIVKAYAKSGDMLNMFSNNEIDAAIIGDFNVGRVQEVLKDAVYVVPQSGTYANMNTLEINAKSKNKDLALEFINYRIKKENMERTGKSLNEAPTNSTVELAPEVSKNMTYADVAKRAKSLDFSIVNKNLSSWIDQFNRLLNE